MNVVKWDRTMRSHFLSVDMKKAKKNRQKNKQTP